jgi:hypothetical protein
VYCITQLCTVMRICAAALVILLVVKPKQLDILARLC